ncbi:MAG: FG-GAP repeat domain-containing protein [Planctomycetota bacterium]
MRTHVRALLLAGTPAALLCTAQAQQFQQMTTFPGTARWTEGVECADVDQDGDLDLFFADGDGFASAGTQRQNVLIINKLVETAAWTFADESVARLGVNLSNGKGVCTGDVTGDGWVDALYANAFFTDPPFLYINQGAANPGFFTQEGAARGLTASYSSGNAQFGDLDDDGDLDLIINDAYLGSPSNKPHLFFNNGTGNFTENAAALGAPNKGEQMDVQLVDIDNDFDLDFFGDSRGVNAGGNHYLMLNNGAGTFSDVSSLVSAGNGSTYESEVGDLDNDSDLDFFFVSLNNFSEGSIRNNLVPSTNLTFTNQGLLGGAVDDNEIALFDYDVDGDYDIVVGSLGTHEYLYRNDGAFAFVDQSVQIQFVSDSTLDCTVADLNNDGKYEIVTGQGESNSPQWTNKFYRNTGAADTRAPVVVAQKDPVSAPASAPVVVHGKIRDQVLDDGVNFVRGAGAYKVLTAPSAQAVSITGGGFSPATLNVTVGTTVTWTNNSAGNQTVESTTTPYTYNSGTIAVAGTYANTFVSPGTYTYQSTPGGFSGTVVVSGVAASAAAKYSGGQIYRFVLNDPPIAAGIAVAYELRFTDWAGNITVTTSRTVPLTPSSLGTSFCFGDGSLATPCPCALPNTVPSPSGAPGHGCANSFDLSGALIWATGTTTPDTVAFTANVGPFYAGFGFLVKGNSSSAVGIVNGDGLRCSDGSLIRFGGHNAGTNGAPLGTWTYPNAVQTVPVSTATLQPGGQNAFYQLFFRNVTASFCNAGTTNWSNGVQVPW